MICGYKIGTQLNRVTKYEGRESQFEGKFGTFCTPPPPKTHAPTPSHKSFESSRSHCFA